MIHNLLNYDEELFWQVWKLNRAPDSKRLEPIVIHEKEVTNHQRIPAQGGMQYLS